MTSLKESILSSTNSGRTKMIETFFENNKYFGKLEKGTDYEILPSGKVIVWNIRQDFTVDEDWPDYIQFAEFEHNRGALQPTIRINSKKALEKFFNSFMFEYDGKVSIGNKANKFKIIISDCKNLQPLEFPSLYGSVTFFRCDVDFRKGYPRLTGDVLFKNSKVKFPFGFEDIKSITVEN